MHIITKPLMENLGDKKTKGIDASRIWSSPGALEPSANPTLLLIKLESRSLVMLSRPAQNPSHHKKFSKIPVRVPASIAAYASYGFMTAEQGSAVPHFCVKINRSLPFIFHQKGKKSWRKINCKK